jgi:hypothetical protein
MMAKLDVVENALDFLRSAAQNLAAFQESGRPEDIKYGLLHLSAGIDLLLKQRLTQEHWSLVFDDLSKTSLSAYESGAFSSVRLADCIARIRSVCGVDISSVHETSVKGLRRLRNKIEHFGFEVSREEGLSIAAKAWSFALDFLQDHLANHLDERQTEGWESIKAKMLGIEQFVQQRSKDVDAQIQAKIKEGFAVVQCPSCLNEALMLDYDERRCIFCRQEGTAEEIFDAWMSCFYGSGWTDPKERMADNPAEDCPSCRQSFYVRMPGEGGMSPPDPAFVCFHCGYSKSPTVECTRCGESFWTCPHF